MQPRWQDIPTDQLETIYNPRAANTNIEAALEQRVTLSDKARTDLADTSIATEDVRYGSAPNQLLDLYQPKNLTDNSAPLVVFIHGGYWRGGDKRESTHVVPALIGAGAVVANINYELCPHITLDEMVDQAIRAVRYCHQQATHWQANPNRLVLIGHSAGAHLAARVMNAPADSAGLPADLVHSVVALSGVYEPEVITKISVNDEAQIDVTTARRNDCLNSPPQGNARYLLAAGAQEPAGWIAQSELYETVVKNAGFQCEFATVPGDHFTMLVESFTAGSDMLARIERLLAS